MWALPAWNHAHALPAGLTAHIRYETFGYPDPDSADESWENFFAATLRGRGQLGSTLTWRVEGRAVADDAGFTAGAYSLRNATRRRPYLSLITGVLDYRPLNNLHISAGKQIVNWSIFDELQPASLITPRDESDAFRRVEQGVPSLSVHWGSGGTFAELVVVPLAFTPSRLPQGRWSIIRGDDAIQPQDLPPVQFEETQAGAHVGTQLGPLEVSVMGYVGRDTAAVFVPGPLIIEIINGRPVFKAQIIDKYPRVRVGGLSTSYPLGDRLMLRAEVVYSTSPDPFRDDFVHTVAGAEYALDDWRIVASYLRDDQTGDASEEVTNKGERRFFQSFIFGEVRYDAGRRLRGRLRGGFDTKGDFLLLQPEVSYRLWQTVWVVLFGDVIDANRSSYARNKISYFDTIRHEDRLGTRIEYQF
jgi:hypothetical protein